MIRKTSSAAIAALSLRNLRNAVTQGPRLGSDGRSEALPARSVADTVRSVMRVGSCRRAL